MKINLHDYVKKHYESGDYDNAYSSYDSNQRRHEDTYKYDNVTRDETNDFDLGYKKGLSDSFNKFKFVPLKLLRWINQLFNGKLHEIIDYIEGYRKAYQHNH
ncbi:hypothetical protein ACLHIM_02840 [Ligilactobacillus sp. LYQ112]|uniref:hypothetical protein n=1 Tax=unclassified Ligilactobacillus TaxID=2767920 RepID=UPI0038552528